MKDPNHEELTSFLNTAYPDADNFDRSEAIYWFANHYHSGQNSSLYAVLSTSEFRPGASSHDLDPDSPAYELYYALVTEFVN